jgi:SAM-dependent methyltransferase
MPHILEAQLSNQPAVELERVRCGQLPERYGYPMQQVLRDKLAPLLRPGKAILDVGSGRVPTLAIPARPERCRYTGVDISGSELESAPFGAYTDVLVHDITKPLPEESAYDLALSWQALEHVRPLELALDNIRRALKPGGTLLAQLSGSRAFFSVAARVMPHRLRVKVAARLLGHPSDEKFPTEYDHCHARALTDMLSGWTTVELTPFYRGAPYFNFSRLLQRTYLVYENAIEARGRRGLATHYLIVAQR